MKKFAWLWLALFFAASFSMAAQKADKQLTFVGFISDSMCGLEHMSDNPRQCTLKCVETGSQFVLADTEHKKVYKLSDQAKPKQFAGDKVKVTGTLDGDTIKVSSIEAAK